MKIKIIFILFFISIVGELTLGISLIYADIPKGFNIVNGSYLTGTFGTLEGISDTSNAGGDYTGINVADNNPSQTTGEYWITLNTVVTNVNLTINFTDSFDFDTIKFFPEYNTLNRAPNNTNIYVSDDFESWTKIIDNYALFDGTVPSANEFYVLNITPQTKRYLRFEFLDNMGGTRIGLSELQIYENVTNLANLSTTTVTVSANADPHEAPNTQDENHNSYWHKAGVSTANVTWNFTTPKDVEWINLLYRFAEMANFSIFSSDDGSTWTEIGNGTMTDDTNSFQVFNFTKTNTQYLRLEIKDSYDGNVGASEIYIFESEEVSADTTNPTITLVSPEQGTQDTDGVIRFIFIPTDNNQIINCSLVYDSTIYTTIIPINDSENIIEVVGVDENHPLYSDDLQWRIDCTDLFNNVGSSETRHLDTKEDISGTSGITIFEKPIEKIEKIKPKKKELSKSTKTYLVISIILVFLIILIITIIVDKLKKKSLNNPNS